MKYCRLCILIFFVFHGILSVKVNELKPQEDCKNFFIEKDGIVSMEAEHATESLGWIEKTGLENSSGVTMLDQEPDEGGYLKFTIKFTTMGTYTVWALHAKSTDGFRPDQANDCFAEFNGNLLELDNKSSCHGEHVKVIGLGTHQTILNWQSRPKTECAEDRNKKVIFNVESPGTYNFNITSRSKGYLLDKLVFVHQDNSYTPQGKGPAETL